MPPVAFTLAASLLAARSACPFVAVTVTPVAPVTTINWSAVSTTALPPVDLRLAVPCAAVKLAGPANAVTEAPVEPAGTRWSPARTTKLPPPDKSSTRSPQQ
jgi:hypothetical protein